MLNRLFTRRLDAWTFAPSTGARWGIAAEALVALASLIIILSAGCRVVGMPGRGLLVLTHPSLLGGALAYAGAAFVRWRLPVSTARDAPARERLVVALRAALAIHPTDDLAAIVRGAINIDQIAALLNAEHAGAGLRAQLERAAHTAAEGLSADPTFVDEILGQVAESLAGPTPRRGLTRWLGRLLVEQPKLARSVARPVTRKLLDEGPFDYRPFSWRQFDRRIEKFIGGRKGRAWTDAVIDQVIDDLGRGAGRGRALRGAIAGALSDALAQHIIDRVVRAIDAQQGGGLANPAAAAEFADRICAAIQPALLNAMRHVADDRAADGIKRIDPDALIGILRRPAVSDAMLGLVPFAFGALAGGLSRVWS